MTIYKAAQFSVRPDGLETAVAAIEEFVAAVRENEAGTRLYVSLRPDEGSADFLHWMSFADAAAEEAHRGSPWVRRFTDALYPVTVEPPRFTDYVAVAST